MDAPPTRLAIPEPIHYVSKNKKPVKPDITPGEIIIKGADKSNSNKKELYVVVFRFVRHAFDW